MKPNLSRASARALNARMIVGQQNSFPGEVIPWQYGHAMSTGPTLAMVSSCEPSIHSFSSLVEIWSSVISGTPGHTLHLHSSSDKRNVVHRRSMLPRELPASAHRQSRARHLSSLANRTKSRKSSYGLLDKSFAEVTTGTNRRVTGMGFLICFSQLRYAMPLGRRRQCAGMTNRALDPISHVSEPSF